MGRATNRRRRIVSAPLIDAKAWTNMQARAALHGVALLRTDHRDGPVRMLAEFSGIVRELRSLDDVEALLVSFAS